MKILYQKVTGDIKISTESISMCNKFFYTILQRTSHSLTTIAHLFTNYIIFFSETEFPDI